MVHILYKNMIYIICYVIEVLYSMYEGGKSSTGSAGLTKDAFRKLLVDATINMQKEEVPLPSLETWISVS